jgi:hypothetical protein
MCYCGDYAGYITVILPFLAFYLCSAYLLYLVSCNVYIIIDIHVFQNGFYLKNIYMDTLFFENDYSSIYKL